MMKRWGYNVITAVALFVISAMGAETPSTTAPKNTEGDFIYPYSGQKISLGNKCASKKVSTLQKTSKQAFQGASIWGHYLFAFVNEMKEINLYDMDADYRRIATITLEGHKRYHCNTVNFGTEYATPSDPCPLLYVSMENAQEHKCVVLRMSLTEGVWNAKPVQTITFPAPSEFGYYPNSYIDRENSRILIGAYQNNDWKTPAKGNGLKWACWNLPKLAQGDVTLSMGEVLHQFTSPFLTATQGGQIEYGKLYQAYGVPGVSKTFLKVMDIATGQTVSSLDLMDCNIAEEPEAATIQGNHLFIIGVSGGLYQLDF